MKAPSLPVKLPFRLPRRAVSCPESTPDWSCGLVRVTSSGSLESSPSKENRDEAGNIVGVDAQPAPRDDGR